MSDQIQGLPPGAIVGPPLQSQPPANQVEGLPPGAIVGPALQPDQTSAEPSFWDKTKHALGQVFSATPEGAGSATSGAGAPELATQFKKDVEASEGPENKLTGAGVIVGGAKSAMEVPQTIGHFVAPNTFSAHPEALETKGTAETAGKIGENILEFMAGDAALKNLNLGARFAKLGKIATLLDEHPVLAKAVEIGGNALRQGTVGAGQTLAHGGTAGEALASGVIVGGTGLAIEGVGQGVKAIKNFVTRNPQVEQMGRELVSGLTEGATPEQVAQTVGKNLADAEEKMHSTYDAGIKKISAQGQNVPVPIAGSPLQQTAKDLLSDSKVPGSIAENLKSVIPDSDKIEPFLTQLSGSNEVFSWDQMEATRQKIGQTIRKLPWDSPIRPDLIKVRYAIDDTLENAAEKAGNSDLSDQIKSLRGEYAQTKGALEERAIVNLRDKNPNAIADVLLNKQSVHNVNTLRRLIGPDNMKVVEGSILDKMIQDASKNGELQGRQLFRKFNSLGPDAKQAVWGDRLPQVTQFMQQAGKLPNVVLDKIVSHYAPYALGTIAAGAIGHGDLKTAAAVGGAAALSALLRNPIVLDAALKGIEGLQKTVPPVASAVMQNQSEDDNPNPTSQNSGDWIQELQSQGKQPVTINIPKEGDHLVHPEDVDEVLKRKPGAKVVPQNQ